MRNRRWWVDLAVLPVLVAVAAMLGGAAEPPPVSSIPVSPAAASSQASLSSEDIIARAQVLLRRPAPSGKPFLMPSPVDVRCPQATSCSAGPEHTMDFRILPSSKDGKPHGSRILHLVPGTFMYRLGFRQGDVIRSCNGHALNCPDDFYQCWQELAKGSADVLVERGTSEIHLRVKAP